MARERRRPGFRLVILGEALIFWLASAADPLAHQVEHPFRNVAAWLRKVSPDLRSTDAKTISRGITVLSSSQRYVKSFDGIAYEVKGKLQEGATTKDINAIREEAELHESKSSAKKAAKLAKLLVEVERALNAAEAAEVASQFDGVIMTRYMREAGLRLLPPPPSTPLPENAADSDTISEAIDVDREATGKIPRASRESNMTRAAERSGRMRSPKSTRTPTGTTRRSPSSKKRDFDGGEGSTLEDYHQHQQQQQQRLKTSREATSQEERVGPKDEEKDQELGEGATAEGTPLEAFVVVAAAGCDVQCIVMVDDRDERLVVAVGDALTGETLLGSLFEEPAVVRLSSHGLMRETAYVNRVAFQCACDILERAGPAIKMSIGAEGPFEGYRVHCVGHSFGGAVAACLAGLLDGAIDVEVSKTRGNGLRPGGSSVGEGECGDEKTVSRERVTNSKGRRNPGIGAREKSRDTSESSPNDYRNERGVEGEEMATLNVNGAARWVGICEDKVTCVTLGCPPCLSPNLRLPFVTSFVLGDDMVPRTSRESLRRLKQRLLQVMPKRKSFISQGAAFGTSLFTDIAGVAIQGVRQATTLGEDDTRLAVPGLVWFAKPRRLKSGATLARVMNGNLREDMLWQLHDIMLTKSMLSHHRLDKYIKTLDRV